MNLKEILSITGQAGLFKYVAQGKGGIIVEALAPDAKRQMVSGSAKVSALGDIAIFTDKDEVALADIFETIFKNSGGKAVDITGKSTPDELHAFMSAALASYDRERVHNSDIKKLASWYNILVAAGVTTFKEEDKEAEAAATATGAGAEKPVAKTTAARRATSTAAGAAAGKAKVSSKPKVTATKGTTARKSS